MTARWRRTASVVATVLILALVVPVSAYAAVRAKATASQKFTVLTWKAVAVAAGGSAGTGSLAITFGKSSSARSAVFDIVNSGTSTLSSVTLTASGSAGVLSTASVAYTGCSVAWTATTNGQNTTHSCGGTSTPLGASSAGGNGSATISQSLRPGDRLYVRAATTATNAGAATSQTIGIKVARNQAAAKRNR